jgi:orotate phosphoribosyltransferase
MYPHQTFVEDLYRIGAVKLGEFTLKSGEISPIYMDLRQIVSHPDVIKHIAAFIWQQMSALSFDVICGVPYTALPIASAISVLYDVPMLIQRKELKNHGTKKRIEGCIVPGQRCLIIEDVVTTGGSVISTKNYLQEEGLIVDDVMVVVNREQGAECFLHQNHLKLYAMTTLSECVSILSMSAKVPDNVRILLKSLSFSA